MSQPTQRPFKTLLVANRGEIAVRIINAAREQKQPIQVFAVASPNDTAHTLALPPSQVLQLPSASDHLNIDLLISLVKKHQIEAVHPGYGFLSESAEFARRMWSEAGAVVVGPGPEILERTGDKLAARRLAEECGVPVLPAMVEPTGEVQDVRAFVEAVSLPVMIKAVDGGGGRGIRLVKDAADLESSFRRAVAESPSRQVFVEKAALDGFRHIEVQIIGDGTGEIAHLWERECSIQRRYQKIVEIAPSPALRQGSGSEPVANIIDAAVRMAKHIKYRSLGTFEFLVNPDMQEFFFLEVNPRLQVEHTITEEVSSVDLVTLQLCIARGTSLPSYHASSIQQTLQGATRETALKPPHVYSVQFRITAENPQQAFSLSIGKIRSFSMPSGHGVRVETNLVSGHDCSVSADFDSLLAKIIVTAGDWPSVITKARRALEDTRIDGVKTNIDVLRAVAASEDFARSTYDTQWLKQNLDRLIMDGEQSSRTLSQRPIARARSSGTTSELSGMSSSSALLRKGDAWNITLAPAARQREQAGPEARHLLRLTRVLRNEFPSLLAAEVEYTTPGSRQPQQYRMTAGTTSASALAGSNSSIRRGDPSNQGHVIVPFAGKLVEVLVDEGDYVEPGRVVCVIKQMKMELEVRAKDQQRGLVKWVTEVEDGAEIDEGTLIAELDFNINQQVPAKL